MNQSVSQNSYVETTATSMNASSLWASNTLSAFSSYLQDTAQHNIHYMNEVEWPDWFWKPLAGVTALALGGSFAIVLMWQHRINRGHQAAYSIQRNEVETE